MPDFPIRRITPQIEEIHHDFGPAPAKPRQNAIVGEGGEVEHAALWHTLGGTTVREWLGESRAIVRTCMKVAPMGGSLDIPLDHINAANVCGDFDSITIPVPDAPRAGEIVFALAKAKGGRINSRMGGLLVQDAKAEDGCR